MQRSFSSSSAVDTAKARPLLQQSTTRTSQMAPAEVRVVAAKAPVRGNDGQGGLRKWWFHRKKTWWFHWQKWATRQPPNTAFWWNLQMKKSETSSSTIRYLCCWHLPTVSRISERHRWNRGRFPPRCMQWIAQGLGFPKRSFDSNHGP